MSDAKAPEAEKPAAAKSSLPLIPLMIGALNFLVALGAAGFIYYAKFIFKRPAITESSERARLEREHAKRPPAAPAVIITLDPLTVNIEPGGPRSDVGGSENGGHLPGKAHFVTAAVALEVHDGNRQGDVEALKPVIIDRVISTLGHKSFNDLVTVQGRYLLRSQLLDQINALFKHHHAQPSKEAPAPAGEDKAADVNARADEAARESEDDEDEADEFVVSNIFFNQFVVQ